VRILLVVQRLRRKFKGSHGVGMGRRFLHQGATLAHLATRCFAQGRRMQHKVQQAQGVGRSRPGDVLHKVGAFSTKCNAFGTRPAHYDQGQRSSWLSADYGWVGKADEMLRKIMDSI
jgi:hypothetical protein